MRKFLFFPKISHVSARQCVVWATISCRSQVMAEVFFFGRRNGEHGGPSPRTCVGRLVWSLHRLPVDRMRRGCSLYGLDVAVGLPGPSSKPPPSVRPFLLIFDQKLASDIADGVVFAHNDLLSGKKTDRKECTHVRAYIVCRNCAGHGGVRPLSPRCATGVFQRRGVTAPTLRSACGQC